MWVARDKDGELNLFIDKPKRFENNWSADRIGTLSSDPYFAEEPVIDRIDGFKNLSWEDKPIEVELISKTDLQYLEERAEQAPSVPYMGE